MTSIISCRTEECVHNRAGNCTLKEINIIDERECNSCEDEDSIKGHTTKIIFCAIEECTHNKESKCTLEKIIINEDWDCESFQSLKEMER